jgi:hypothetical protein
MEKLFSENKPIIVAILIIIISGIFSLVFVYNPYRNTFENIYPILNNYEKNREIYSFVGDFFGGMLNPILSFAGLLLLLLTLYVNSKDLKLSREIANKEKFENTFFKMFDLFQSFLKEITEPVITSSELSKLEAKCHFEYYDSPIRDVNEKLSIYDFVFKAIQKRQNDKITEQQKFVTTFDNRLNKFFNTLFQILKHIDRNNNVIESQIYIDIIRASFSLGILSLLEIYFFAEKESDKSYKYHCLVKKYFPELYNNEISPSTTGVPHEN